MGTSYAARWRRIAGSVAVGSAVLALAAPSHAAPAAGSAAGFKSCKGTAGANGYFKHLKAKVVSCKAARTVMKSYVKVFLNNGSHPPAVVYVQGFSCVDNHPNGDTRIDNVVCKGTGDNSVVKFRGRSKLPQPH